MPWPPRFLFTSGRLSVDFALTGGEGDRARWERWDTPADLADWMREHPLLKVPAEASPRDLKAARELREAIWHGAQAIMHGASVPPWVEQGLTQHAARPPLVPALERGRMTWTEEQPARAVLSTVSRDAIELFGTGLRERLRECENPDADCCSSTCRGLAGGVGARCGAAGTSTSSPVTATASVSPTSRRGPHREGRRRYERGRAHPRRDRTGEPQVRGEGGRRGGGGRMTRYVALLRGINVGGKNLIKMADLKACFEHNGFEDVATYIQSGNVVFATDGASQGALTDRIERMLADAFAYDASVVVRSRRQMRAIVDRAPAGFGADPAAYRYDVIFLKSPLTARAAMGSVLTRDGVDRAHAGSGVLYFSRLTSRASQSRLSRIVSMPIYRSMTIRNWNTTVTLHRMLEG